jgi:putative ABC transport system permease protein
VFQFALATFLIIATFLIYSQFNYLMHFNLGYDDTNTAIVNTGTIDRAKLDVFRSEIRKDPAVLSVTADQGGEWGTIARINGNRDMSFDFKHIDENYFPQFRIPVVKGRNFSADYATDTANAIMINEAFAREAGWDEPIGKQVDFFYDNKKFTVIGVIKDYHYAALTKKIGPQLFNMHPQYQYRDVYIKLREGSVAGSLKYIEKVYKSMFPLKPYQYHFRDKQNEAQYEKEAMWKKILTFGAILTIFISCIGLFGLAALAAEKRTKEIGIRKVLGASAAVIVRKLSVDFLRLVLLASIIAIPAARWLMGKWLENYPYRIAMSGWIFAAAVVIVACVALFTISFQAIRAARANPVKSLRSE